MASFYPSSAVLLGRLASLFGLKRSFVHWTAGIYKLPTAFSTLSLLLSFTAYSIEALFLDPHHVLR